jgi:preprotein translocase subunit SecG
MLVLIVILTTIVCVLLAFFVLIQNPKGGGLGATFGGISTNLLGAQRTTDVLEKGTWYLAIFLIGLSLVSEFFTKEETIVTTDQFFRAPDLPGAGAGTVNNTPTPSDESHTVWPFGGPVTPAR